MNKKLLSENDQVRNMVHKMRSLISENISTAPENIDSTVDKTGEKVQFDGINTVGFLETPINDNIKNNLITAIGEFIKATGLLMNSINISVGDGRVILNTETLKNPGIENIRAITIDTESDYPKIDFISGSMNLDQDLIMLLQNIYKTYVDNQVGRERLVTATQNTM